MNHLQTLAIAKINESESNSSETSSESSSSESDSEEYEVNATKKKITFSDTKRSKKHKSARPKTSSKKSSNAPSDKKSSKDARPLKIPIDNISLNAFFAILQSMVNLFTRTQPKEVSINEGSQSEAEISWPNPIEINFIHKIIPNDVTTICCKISLPLGKIVQVPSAMIDSGANCSVISKGLIKLLGAEVDKNSLEFSGISYNILVMVGQGENSCTISEDFPVIDENKP
ncbi:hypothetical protein F8M41_012046 [Gigaspora margarita]|uniref:Aspartic peptidase DDI1-type domain-containing protein n=1 Tax=Gigaspora margarita TaxID=4874 RepID=A0A8H4ATF6_GIGMA|nr:hypothetical protein F8M41_012046 [Gigaspora margarita]